MCGIIAITGKSIKKIDDDRVKSMISSLSKRGPDEKDFLRTDEAIIGQTRLSIVDIAGGHQPMKDNVRNHTIVFNGEIYGYKETRLDLESKGHIFSTSSDTEVILKAYAEYGKECPLHLDGMFAFAIWDADKKELFVARDRFGKKPFYYTWAEGMFFAASEIKALFETKLIKGTIDHKAIDNYLELMYIPPWRTVYSNIHNLPPAHAGIVKDGKLDTWKYWQLENKPIKISYSDAKQKIKSLFDEAVRKRMVADVEIGCLLSGGVDSTLVAAYAQKYTTRPLKTFSVGYENHINELPYALEASKKIGTDHHTLQAKNQLVEELEKVVSYMDEPHADSSNLSQHLISELASSQVKVAMTGDGADELFMGYGWYWKYLNVRKVTRIKNALFSNQFKEHIKHISIFSRSDRKNLWLDARSINDDIEKKAANSQSTEAVKKINDFDLSTYLPGQLLSKIDRTSMMHSLEVRSPFLDYRLAEFVYNIPTEYKMDGKKGKIILKDLLREIMPDSFVDRRKQGFGAPVKEWLRTDPIKKFIQGKLIGNSELNRIFKEKEIRAIVDRFYGKNDNSVQYKLWSLLCLALWLTSHKKYHV